MNPGIKIHFQSLLAEMNRCARAYACMANMISLSNRSQIYYPIYQT